MCEIESIYHISSIILNIIIIGGLVWFISGLFKAHGYEIKIIELYKELELKIENQKERRGPMEIINLRTKHLKEEYKPKIENLERKRRFILDKLPFIK